MANTKRYVYGYHKSTSDEPQIIIQRVSDGYFWDDGVGFIANGGTPVLNAMNEIFHDFWEYETSLEIWANGQYNILIEVGHPAPPNGSLTVAYIETISADTQIGYIEASSITSRNAVTAIRDNLTAMQKVLDGLVVSMGVLADRIDSMNQVLSRRDYRSSTPE